MERDIAIDASHKILSGCLPKTGGSYDLVLLTRDNIDAMLALQKMVFDGLAPQEKPFLLPKDRAFLEGHFSAGSSALGVVHDGRLVAQSLVVNPTPAHPDTGMTDMALPAAPEKLTVMQGVVVDPAYRGNALMTVMIGAWLALASVSGRSTALAEAATGNRHSWAAFLQEGLSLHSIGTDKSDGTVLYNIHAEVAPLMKRRLSPDFNKAAAKGGVSVPMHDIAEQKKMLARGYEGVVFDAPKKAIVFRRPAGP